MMWLTLITIALATHVFFEAALFRFYVRQCSFCGVIRGELLRYSEAVMFLAVAYLCAKLRWLVKGLDMSIPEADSLIWGAIESCFLYLIIWTCRTGRELLKMNRLQFNQCFAKHHLGA